MTDELLAKLEKLDPETWVELDACRQVIELAPNLYGDHVYQDTIVGEISRAIAAHGWGCYQYHYRRGALQGGQLPEFAYISTGEVSVTGESETPAEALLAAYVAALEAEGEHGSE